VRFARAGALRGAGLRAAGFFLAAVLRAGAFFAAGRAGVRVAMIGRYRSSTTCHTRPTPDTPYDARGRSPAVSPATRRATRGYAQTWPHDAPHDTRPSLLACGQPRATPYDTGALQTWPRNTPYDTRPSLQQAVRQTSRTTGMIIGRRR
jgi:hypothetical protein